MKSRRTMLLSVLLAVLAGTLSWEFWPGDETVKPATAQTAPETTAASRTANEPKSVTTADLANAAPKTPQFIEVKAWAYETTAGQPGLQYTFDPVKFAQSPPAGVKLAGDSTALLKNGGRVIVYSGPDGMGVTSGNYTQTEVGPVTEIEPGTEDDTIRFSTVQISGEKPGVEFLQDGGVSVMGGTLSVGVDEFHGSGNVILAGGSIQWSASTASSAHPAPSSTSHGATDGGTLKLAPGDNPSKNSLLVDFGPRGTGPGRFAVLAFRILSAEEVAKLPTETPEKN